MSRFRNFVRLVPITITLLVICILLIIIGVILKEINHTKTIRVNNPETGQIEEKEQDISGVLIGVGAGMFVFCFLGSFFLWNIHATRYLLIGKANKHMRIYYDIEDDY